MYERIYMLGGGSAPHSPSGRVSNATRLERSPSQQFKKKRKYKYEWRKTQILNMSGARKLENISGRAARVIWPAPAQKGLKLSPASR